MDSRASRSSADLTSGMSSTSAFMLSGSRRVGIGRLLFLVCLSCLGAGLGYAAFYLLTLGEAEVAESQFESIADRALDSAQGIMLRKRLGTVSMASIASNVLANASAWPFVYIPGYEEISTNLIETSSGREMGFCPFVNPDQLSDFEDFAYDYYENSRVPPFPNGTGVSSFGKGVWGVNPALNTSDNRYHETDGSTYYNSSNYIFAPILHHNEGAFPALMLNLHFQETRGVIIDDMIDCANDRATKGNLSIECISITDMLNLTSQDEGTGPGALIMQPIYPAFNPAVLTGLIASSIVWEEVLEDVFASEVRGIDCVLETQEFVYTYSVNNGKATVRGTGDLHDTSYQNYRRTIDLTKGVPGLFSAVSTSYTLSLYPSDEFFDIYRTKNPTLAAIGAVCIIIFTSLCFFLYDFFVHQEFNAKQDLLEAKRKFMRFVSHEVRTPLNSVCMGLTLMREEIYVATGMSKGHGVPQESDVPTISTVKREKVMELLSLTNEIYSNAQSSVDVLNDLLNYDKIEMGTFKLELSVIPIWSLIERTSIEFTLPATKKRIRFEVDFNSLICDETKSVNQKCLICDQLPKEIQDLKTIGDTIRITQVVRNLLSNAVKFTPEEGTMTVCAIWKRPPTENHHKVYLKKVTLSSGEVVEYARKGEIVLTVTDTGAGMSPDQLSKLFGDGVQFNVNALQAGNGSGLGLFITKGIVEQHGGTLSASSEGLGKGTTFKMVLPLVYAPDSSPEETADGHEYANALRAQEQSLKPMPLRVLLVDDALTNRKLLKRLLQNHGHTCEEAKDGQEAVDHVKQSMEEGNPFDSILMDSEMPVMNGPTATMEIRALGCDAFIVGLTGNVLPEDVAYFKQCGANDVLPKPFNLSQLEGLWVEYGLVGGNRAATDDELRDTTAKH